MKHLSKNNCKVIKNINAGFTLVEMIVVLTIIVIMMSGAVWGVTRWIAHYEYVSSEEKARTVYLATQSALSAAESRGTLDEYMKELEPDIVTFSEQEKIAYGLPTKQDNEGQVHEYGYLVVDKGDYESDDTKALFKVLDTYVSDPEQLNASIIIEFDLTSKKVYSVFYSGWSTSLKYGNDECVERGDFYVNSARRAAEEREGYQVGYYGADQVNVVKLDNLPELKMLECQLHNEETLYLTVKSSSSVAESDTVFDIRLYEKDVTSQESTPDNSEAGDGNETAGDDTAASSGLLCRFSFKREDLGYAANEQGKPVLVKDVVVYDAKGDALPDKYDFIASYNEWTDDKGNKDHCLKIVLDALTTEQTMAMLSEPDKATGLTDSKSFSVTRLIGTDPKDIYAKVIVKPYDKNQYAESSPKKSNIENSLYGTKEDDSEYSNDNSVYLIKNNRHLINIRYAEEYGKADDRHVYMLANDIDFNESVIYDKTNMAGASNASGGYEPLKTDDENFRFAMIPKLNSNSELNGDGHVLSNFIIDNKSSIIYAREENGEIKLGSPLVNQSKTLGLIGINRGEIRRLIISNAKVNAVAKVDYKKSEAGIGKTDETVSAIYSDNIEAVGVICGRNEGSITEIYFNNENGKMSSVEATVFVNLDDTSEAEMYGVDANASDINQRFGCGVGMVSGTVALSEGAKIDRIQTSGTVNGKVTGTAVNYKETPEVSDTDARKNIYNNKPATGESKSNAQYYTYGVGGVFGYVYGQYNASGESTALGIGVDEEIVEANNAFSEDNGGYYPMEIGPEGSKKRVFAADETRSIINKTNVKAQSSFTGGIVGNLYISGLEYINNGDATDVIPVNAIAQMSNCHNYGTTEGYDFVGGVVGVNGYNSYIKDCISYGSPKATGGVSAGITSENFGYISECRVERAAADPDNDNKPYVPNIEGNMVFAGAITSVNHKGCIVYNCEIGTDDTGLSDNIMVTGSDVSTFGYIVGDNYGIVDKGKVGQYLGYESKRKNLIIGGAVGTNHKDATVKNIEVGFDLDTKTAINVGGVVGKNSGVVNKCTFSGSIRKTNSSSGDNGLAYGGIVAVNIKEGNSGSPVVSECRVEGGVIEAIGLNRSNSVEAPDVRIEKSSAVGGICGVNNEGCKLVDCYVSSRKEADNNVQSSITVEAGMVGGIVAVNAGTVDHCGGLEVLDGETYNVTDASGILSAVFAEKIDVGDTLKNYLEVVGNADSLKAHSYTSNLNAYMMALEGRTGTISVSEEHQKQGINAYDKADYEKHSNDIRNKANTYIIRMNNGEGNLGGIVGYNIGSGNVIGCATGKWIVESYLTTRPSCIGGIIGENTSNGRIEANANLAYVRRELTDSGKWSERNDWPILETHEKYYVGGVIGEQNITTSHTWEMKGCANLGTVLNCHGNNVGGVISKWKADGGTVSHCFNYGTLITGYQHDRVGTAGGIVAHCYKLTPDQVINVLSCENHGIVNLAMEGICIEGNYTYKDENGNLISDSRSYLMNENGKKVANDVGGILGELSAPNDTEIYTVNIKDCVNGHKAKIYTFSLGGGILGWTGGENEVDYNESKVDSLFVNVDRCRNYSSDIWSVDIVNVDTPVSLRINHRDKLAGILCERAKYTNENTATGYTTVTNCLSYRFTGFEQDGWYNAYSKIYASVDDNRYNKDFFKNIKYSRNNFIIDELSFHYADKKSDWLTEIVKSFNMEGDYPKKLAAEVDAGTNIESPSDELYEDTNDSNNAGIMDSDKEALHSKRLHAITYLDENGNRKNAFAYIDGETSRYRAQDITQANTRISEADLNKEWNSDDWPRLIGRRNNGSDEETIGEVIPYMFDETGVNVSVNTRSFDKAYNRDHFWFRYQKENNNDFALESQLPTADPWDSDFDYDEFDSAYLSFIDHINNKIAPDEIAKPDIRPNGGYYDVTWDFINNGVDDPTATEFDVEIHIYKQIGDTPDISVDEKVVVKDTLCKKAYGRRTTFIPPEYDDNGNLIDYLNPDNQYYATVRVRDARGGKYSEYATRYLNAKLKKPEFEIVSYKNEWVLHLLNPEDYKNCKDKVEVGLYYSGAPDVKFTIDLKKDWESSDEILKYYKEGITTNVNDKVVYGYATCEDYLDSDLYVDTVYIPKDVQPAGMDVEYTNVTNNLDDAVMPDYSATLNYTATENVRPQVFRLELYGVNNQTGDTETLAKHEYTVTAGKPENIAIGYYDFASNINVSDYHDFGVECWYASTGQGNVYKYFTVDQNKVYDEKGITKPRSTGYVKDISEGEAQFFFHSVTLPKPDIDIVGLDRKEPKLVVRLKNPQDYAGMDGVKINLFFEMKDRTVEAAIDLGRYKEEDLLPGDLPYYDLESSIRGNWVYVIAVASGEQYESSGRNVYTRNNNNDPGWMYVPKNLHDDDYYKLNLTAITPKNDESFRVEDGKLYFEGSIKYQYNGIPKELTHFYRYEVYGKKKNTNGEYDTNDGYETLFLSDDIKTVNNNYNYNNYESGDINIDGLDVSGYEDIHIQAWYSGYHNYYGNNEENPNENNSRQFIAHYYEIDSEVAKSMIDSGEFKRESGYIKDITKGEDNPRYYYVAAIADSSYGDTESEGYKDYVLLRKMEDVIVPKFEASVDDVDLSLMRWQIGEKDNAAHYDVKYTYYMLNKSSTPASIEYVEKEGTKVKVGDTDTFVKMVDTASFAVGEPDGQTFDFNNYDYYVVACAKDYKLTDDNYSNKVLLKVRQKLPEPEIRFTCLELSNTPVWYVYLANPEAFENTGAKIHVNVPGTEPEYIINTSGKTAIDGVLPYGVKINVTLGSLLYGSITAYAAYADGGTDESLNSEKYTYNNDPIWLWEDFDDDLKTKFVGIDETECSIDKANNKLSYKGTFNYQGEKEKQHMPIYVMTELYALDKNNNDKPVTLYMQLSDPFVTKNDSGDSKWEPKTSLDIDITIDSIDLSRYHDFHVSVWLAQTGIDKYNISNFEMLYFEIPESIAKANGYDRQKGIITYKKNGETKYYYSTVLRSNKYSPWPACNVPCETKEPTETTESTEPTAPAELTE